jgi:hypothetical protein
MRVALVDVEDLYDEFNSGAPSPHAIRAFLRVATERCPDTLGASRENLWI